MCWVTDLVQRAKYLSPASILQKRYDLRATSDLKNNIDVAYKTTDSQFLKLEREDTCVCHWNKFGTRATLAGCA